MPLPIDPTAHLSPEAAEALYAMLSLADEPELKTAALIAVTHSNHRPDPFAGAADCAAALMEGIVWLQDDWRRFAEWGSIKSEPYRGEGFLRQLKPERQKEIRAGAEPTSTEKALYRAFVEESFDGGGGVNEHITIIYPISTSHLSRERRVVYFVWHGSRRWKAPSNFYYVMRSSYGPFRNADEVLQYVDTVVTPYCSGHIVRRTIPEEEHTKFKCWAEALTAANERRFAEWLKTQ